MADQSKIMTAKQKQEFESKIGVLKIPVELFYDLWRCGKWIGMAHGFTPQEARRMVVDSLGEEASAMTIMTPYMGCGTSHDTYQALIGTPFK